MQVVKNYEVKELVTVKETNLNDFLSIAERIKEYETILKSKIEKKNRLLTRITEIEAADFYSISINCYDCCNLDLLFTS